MTLPARTPGRPRRRRSPAELRHVVGRSSRDRSGHIARSALISRVNFGKITRPRIVGWERQKPGGIGSWPDLRRRHARQPSPVIPAGTWCAAFLYRLPRDIVTPAKAGSEVVASAKSCAWAAMSPLCGGPLYHGGEVLVGVGTVPVRLSRPPAGPPAGRRGAVCCAGSAPRHGKRKKKVKKKKMKKKKNREEKKKKGEHSASAGTRQCLDAARDFHGLFSRVPLHLPDPKDTSPPARNQFLSFSRTRYTKRRPGRSRPATNPERRFEGDGVHPFA